MTQEDIRISDAELEIILHDLIDLYGYDFTDYSRLHLKEGSQD